MECIMFSLHRGCKLWNLTDPWWAKWYVPDSKLSVTLFPCVQPTPPYKYTQGYYFVHCHLKNDWSLGMGTCHFGHVLTYVLVHWHAGTQWGAFPVHCNLWTFWGRGGSFCTLPNLGKEGVARGYLYVAKSTHKGIPGVPYPWQSQPQKMVPQTMHLERGSKSNSIEDHLFLDRRNEDYFLPLFLNTFRAQVWSKSRRPFLYIVYTVLIQFKW